MIPFSVATLLPGLLLLVGVFHWLRRAGFERPNAVELALLSFAQAGTTMAFASTGTTLWLAVGIAALGSSAAAFAEREDLRSVILFGGSLAAVQLCDPSGAVVATGMLPATFVLGARRAFKKAAGFYVSLLFLPLCMAAVLFFLAREGHTFTFDAAGAHVPYATPLIRTLLVVAPALIAAPSLFLARETNAGRTAALVTAAVLFAQGFAALNGVVREPAAMISVSAPLSALAIAALPRSPGRMRYAVAAAVAGVALSWAAFALASG